MIHAHGGDLTYHMKEEIPNQQQQQYESCHKESTTVSERRKIRIQGTVLGYCLGLRSILGLTSWIVLILGLP